MKPLKANFWQSLSKVSRLRYLKRGGLVFTGEIANHTSTRWNNSALPKTGRGTKVVWGQKELGHHLKRLAAWNYFPVQWRPKFFQPLISKTGLLLVESMALPHPVQPEQHHPGVHPLHGARLSQGGVWVRLLVESQLTCIEGSQFSGKGDDLLAGEPGELVVEQLHGELELRVGVHHDQAAQREDEVVERGEVEDVVFVSEQRR